MTDDSEPTKEELAERVDQLESTVQKMLPDRRQALKGLAVGGAGLGLGSTLSGSAAGQQFSSSTGAVGTSAEPLVEVFSQTGTFQSVSTDQADVGTNISGVTEVVDIGSDGVARSSDRVAIGDDAQTTLIPAFAAGEPARLMIASPTLNVSAILTAIGDSITIQESIGSWVTSDTDGNSCVFRAGGNDLVLKNRTGASEDYVVWVNYLDTL